MSISTDDRSPDFGAKAIKETTTSPTSDPAEIIQDPFAAQRTTDNDPFSNQRGGDGIEDSATSPPNSPIGMSRDRRMSKEWDASKVPPSRFQRREGSIYATQGSRDGHISKGKDRDQGYHDKLKEKVGVYDAKAQHLD
ncbi:hypothetical protein MMC14_004776 [Varicellaria rhodocarpa]|nr:hypothetical protein [Varicellaria rhodocarpa]